MKRTHIDLFADNSWGWTLSNAQITGGVLDVSVYYGYGRRYPDSNWYSGANDDFILQVDSKLDSVPTTTAMQIVIKLDGDDDVIYFASRGTNYNDMDIWWKDVVASQAYIEDTNWHTAKIRRVGTVYYFSIDGGDEISWDYGTERAIEYIQFVDYSQTGEWDNFKYSWIELGKGTGVGNPTIL